MSCSSDAGGAIGAPWRSSCTSRTGGPMPWPSGWCETATRRRTSCRRRGLAGFREEARFETWMHRIVVNTALNDLRRRGRFGEVMDDAVLDAPAPDRVEQRAVERDALERGLAALPSGQRTVIVLKDVYGLSCREIGRELGIEEGAVKVRLHRARKRLRELLSDGRSDGEV